MASGVKRSLFSKPAWAAKAAAKADPSTENESIFGRNLAYHDIVRAQKAEKERKAAKAKAQKSEEHDAKRRRISNEPDKQHDSDNDEVRREEGKQKEKPVTRSTPQEEKALKAGLVDSPKHRSPHRKNRKVTMISLEADDEDDELVMLTPPKPKNTTPRKKSTRNDNLEDDSDEEEDDYLRELKQKAREKARLQREQGSSQDKRSGTPLGRGGSTGLEHDNAHLQDVSRPSSSTSAHLNRSTPQPGSVQQIPEDDPLLKILIQSTIPGTKSLIVKRKASQSLRQVKEFWCKKFELPEELAEQVFFTWRGTRLFDSTTMRGIVRGLKKDSWQKEKAQRTSGGNDSDYEDEQDDEENDVFDERKAKDPSEGKILLEAMTQDIQDQRVREREKQRRQQTGNISTDDEHGFNSDADGSRSRATTHHEEKDNSIIIRLVAKNLEPMQLRVRPHTTVEKIMRGFKATRAVDEGKTAWLIFEGERLEPEATVEEVGFEDEGMVDVSIR